MKLFEKSLCLGLILTVLISFTGFAAASEDIPNHVLRLHVLANSDSEADQTLKLKVRDRILKESAGMFDGAATRAQAEEITKAELSGLKAAAEDEIRKQGATYPVGVELTRMYFTTRKYDTVTLPAGTYDALRVTIGKAEGKNWWCVIFPPMCLPAASEKKELSDVLNADQLQIVEGGEQFEIKFKALEWYEALKSRLEGGESSPASGAESWPETESQVEAENQPETERTLSVPEEGSVLSSVSQNP